MDGGGTEQPDLDAVDLAALRRAMDGLRDNGRRGSAAPVSGFRPRFADLESWVHEFFVLTFGRHAEQGCWCAQWWDHPEAVLRLDALWRTWEVASSLDPVHGVADWIHNHLDPNLAKLLGAGGPFARCAEGRHVPNPVLPVSAPPDDFGTPPRRWWEVLGEGNR